MEDKLKDAEARSVKIDALGVESGQQAAEYVNVSAHAVDKDSWQQVGLLLVTGFNCAYVLSFSNLMLVPLGWAWGLTALVAVGAFAFYANWLLAEFHIIDGHRFIRYRDIMDYVFGRRLYYTTWVLQFVTLLLVNMGFVLLGGRALKEINSEFSSSPVRLQMFLTITGFAYFIFANLVPSMSAMRNWLATSAILTVIYDVILFVILVKDGRANKSKDYNISGNEVDKFFNAFGAIAAILVCNTCGLLPEMQVHWTCKRMMENTFFFYISPASVSIRLKCQAINAPTHVLQSTLRKPAVSNMRKALSLQFTFGLAIYYGVSIVGYWAYGSSVSDYLPKELSGPKWAKVLINSTAFLQSIVSQHMFIAPIHEALDTKFLSMEESTFSTENLIRRFLLRALVFGINTFVAALFPFMGDFVNLFGSFALFPLTFVFPSMIFVKVKGKSARRGEKAWHCAVIVISSLLSLITTAAAIRLIISNARKYRFFADT